MTWEPSEGHAVEAPEAGGTRRALIGGAAAFGLATAVARPLAASAADAANGDVPCMPDPAGIETGAMALTPNGRTIWTTDAHSSTITAHRVRGLKRGRSIDVGGAPVDIAISPRGDLAFVTTAFFDHPGLAVVDLRTGEVDRLDVGPDPHGVALSPSGRSAYVSGGGAKGTLTRVDPATRRVDAPMPVGAHPRGLAVLPGGKKVLVAVNGAAQVAVVAVEHGRVTRRIATAPFPDRLATSPHGSRALVTHNGFGARTATLIELTGKKGRRQLRVGADPTGAHFSPSGRTALVTTASGIVAVLDGRTGRRRRSVRSAGRPSAVVVVGSRGIVADGRTGSLAAIRLGVA